jgi:putative Holliday junction resolvase
VTVATCRAVGLDLGDRRIGVALSDNDGTVALPFETVSRSGDTPRDHRRLAELVAEAEADVVVVGLPLSLDGAAGPAATKVLAEVEVLDQLLDVPVVTWDERLSTVEASRSLRAAGVNAKAQRAVIDKVAASVILQGWLDHRSNGQDLTR